MKNKNLVDIQKLQDAIDSSMNIIEELCPKNNVVDGIKPRDTYLRQDKRSFSMFTACEILWAIASTGIYSKTFYLQMELLSLVNKEIENEYFENNDRIFEAAFLMLATTSAGQQIGSNEYTKTITTLIESQKQDGSWGSYKDGDADLRATALCTLSLIYGINYVGKSDIEPYSKMEIAVVEACKWINNKFTNEGYCKRIVDSLKHNGRVEEVPGIELTSWCTLALINALITINGEPYSFNREQIETKAKKAITWLLSLNVDEIAQKPEIEVELYKTKFSDEVIKHHYGSGSLEVTILALLSYRKSFFYNYISGFDTYIGHAVQRLLMNKNDVGQWFDKNSDSYAKAWPVSYAIKVLCEYRDFLKDNDNFHQKLRVECHILIGKILSFFKKYILAIIFLALTILVIIFHAEIESYITFFDTNIATAIGIILSGISVIQGVRK